MNQVGDNNANVVGNDLTDNNAAMQLNLQGNNFASVRRNNSQMRNASV